MIGSLRPVGRGGRYGGGGLRARHDDGMEAGRTSSGMWNLRGDGWIRNGKLTELVSRYARPASFLEKKKKGH